MTKLQMFVRFTDGTGRVASTQRDDAVGRAAIDREAWLLLSRPRVASVQVDVVRGRVAGRSRGSWR